MNNNTMRKFRRGGAVLLWLAASANAIAAKPMTDGQLARVTAGSAAAIKSALAADSVIVPLQFNQPLSQGGDVSGAGSLTVQRAATDASVAQLALSGSAQSNLRALVSVNAVNSPVEVLLNLTVNVNSSVGKLTQVNLTNLATH